MKRLLPVAIAIVVLAGIGTAILLANRSASIPTKQPAAAPAVGSCWNVAPNAVASMLPWHGAAVACAGSHTAEIYYRGQVDHALIGAFRSSDKQKSRAASAVMQDEARTGCTGHATGYLGGPWRSAQLTIVPDFIAPQKDGFYACVAAQVADPGGTKVQARSTPLRGALNGQGAKGLGIDCYAQTAQDTLSFVRCSEDHSGEYVGLYTVTPLGAPFNGPELKTAVTNGCQALLNRFLGLPSAAANRSDLRSSYVGPTTADTWTGSDQSYACYASASVTMRGSVKGLGTRPLPHRPDVVD